MAAVVSQILVQTLRLDQHVSLDLPLQLSVPARGGVGGRLACLAAKHNNALAGASSLPLHLCFSASFYLSLIADTPPQHSFFFSSHRDVPPADCGMD